MNLYTYKLRPGYGTKKLLIEFTTSNADQKFFDTLLKAIKSIHFVNSETIDLWMNDEVVWNMKSDVGGFEISKDVWGNVFIMADENQKAILKIDGLLEKNTSFKKEKVNYSDYK